VIRIDLRRLNEGDQASNITLEDGDTVYVPRAATIYVDGQVRRPGSYPIPEGTTVRQVLSLAGGVSEFGAVNRVKILRVVNGQEREIKAKLTDQVMAGDTVVVPERYF
jgi:polysaccharide export outer membrane protein